MSRTTTEVLAVSFLLAMSLTFMHIFQLAYLSDYEVTVYINKYGEAIPELLILTLIVWPVISVGLYLYVHD
jgi:hypothetical protein